MSVDEEVCEVAVEDDHDGKGASSGGCSDATDEDEDHVGEAGEAKLRERKPLTFFVYISIPKRETEPVCLLPIGCEITNLGI